MRKSNVYLAIGCLAVFGIASYLYRPVEHLVSGQRMFDDLCREKAGARFFRKIESNMGWTVDAENSGLVENLAHMPNFAFVRYTDFDGGLVDVWNAGRSEGATIGRLVRQPADLTQFVRYKYVLRKYQLDDPRFHQWTTEVVDLKDGVVAASFTLVVFEWIPPDKMILNAPTGVSCGQQDRIAFDRAIFFKGRG